MAGLLNTKQDSRGAAGSPARGGSRPVQAEGGAPGADTGEPQASREEQAVYDSFVTNGMRMIYDPKVMPQIVQTIAGDGNPVEGLANALALVVSRLDDSASQAGQQVDPKVRAEGTVELLENLAELAGPKGADVHEFTREEMETAFAAAADLYDAKGAQQAGGGGPPGGGGAQQQPPAQPGGGGQPSRGLMPTNPGVPA